jgi:hypothetical protein
MMPSSLVTTDRKQIKPPAESVAAVFAKDNVVNPVLHLP